MSRKRRVKEIEVSDAEKPSRKINRKRHFAANLIEAAVDSGLQSINEDVSCMIIDYLKEDIEDLAALGLTCSKWYNSIYMDRKLRKLLTKEERGFRHFLPNSFSDYDFEKEDILYELSECALAVRDLQRFQFEVSEIPRDDNCNDIYVFPHAIPWSPNIVFTMTSGWFVVADFNNKKGKIITVHTAPEETVSSRFDLNLQRKQVALSFVSKSDDCVNSQVFVYNVSDDGDVQLATQFVNDFTSVNSDARSFLHLSDDGIVWHALANRLVKFLVDKNEHLAIDLELNDLAGIYCLVEHHGRTLLFYEDNEEKTRIYDMTKKKSVGQALPKFSAKSMRSQVKNNLAFLIDNQTNQVEAIINLRSYKLRNIKPSDAYCDIVVSSDGSKLASYIYSKKRSETLVYEVHGNDLVQVAKYSVHGVISWIDNSKVLVATDENLQIYNFNPDSYRKKCYYSFPMNTYKIEEERFSVAANHIFFVNLSSRGNLAFYRMIV